MIVAVAVEVDAEQDYDHDAENYPMAGRDLKRNEVLGTLCGY